MARKQHTYNSGRIHRAGSSAPQQQAYHAPTGGGRQKKAKKKHGARNFLIVMVLIIGIGAAGIFGALQWANSWFDTGEYGSVNTSNYTPKEFKGDVINILFVGIDFEQGRTHELTDMILYINYDLKNNKINMLQIPRDSFVGYSSSGGYSSDGKINAAMTTGERNINNLVQVVTEQFKLPVDKYVALDMDGMKEIVDRIGPILVYVPQDMSYGGSALEEGWRWLDGDASEFFVRNRHGTGFERADIDRLDNQRYFFSGMFRRLLSLEVTDLPKLIPVIQHYCYTDFDVYDVMDLLGNALSIEAEDILMCKVPGATSVPGYDGFYVIDVYGRGTDDEPGLANLLNMYFREYGGAVSASELGDVIRTAGSDIPTSVALYPPNVQVMQNVQDSEIGGDGVDPTPS